jgi:nitrous oxidase accessory protein NosD
MNDDARLERLLADALAGAAPSRAPARVRADIKATTSRARQRPRWLALIKEPPMRLSSRVAVGSPTARLASILLATLLLAVMATGAVLAGASLLAGPGVIVVAQDGSGTYTTITEAVSAAEDGDTILIRPGTYTEAVVIEADITMRGDGPREDIVIQAPEDGPTAAIEEGGTEQDPYAILLLGTEATLSGLTFRGQPGEVFASGGAPVLEDLLFEGTGFPYDGSTTSARGSSIVVNAGSTATITSNTLTGGGPIGVFDDSEPLVEGNTLKDGPHIFLMNPGDATVIRDNSVSGTLDRAVGIFSSATVLLEGNTILDAGAAGISIWASGPRVLENSITGTAVGIQIQPLVMATIEANTLIGNQVAMILNMSDAHIAGNDIHDNLEGVRIQGGSPTLTGNTVRGGTTGLVLTGPQSTPTLIDNTICDNEANLTISGGAEMPDTAGNEICPDAPSDASE